MKRRSKDNTVDNKVDLIITADWHLFEETKNPPCRLDNIWDAQWDKIAQIKELQKEHKCFILNAGDIFEHWKTSPYLINTCIEYFPEQMDCIAGNHDMPQHNFELINKSGFDVLCRSGTIGYLYGHFDWGKIVNAEIPDGGVYNNKNVIVAHIMTYKGKAPWPGCSDPNTQEVFDIFPDADLIITGHNHKTFTDRKGDQLLINPGSLTRHKADQEDHKPCVFLYNAKEHDYKIHYLNYAPASKVMSREHIEKIQRKNKQIEAFVEKLKNDWDVSLDYKENLEKSFMENSVPSKIKQIIYNWLDGVC